MVERLVALARGLDEDRQVGARLRLADEFRQQLRAQRGVGRVLSAALRRDDAGGRGHEIEIARPKRRMSDGRAPLPLAGSRQAKLALRGWGWGSTRGPPPWLPPSPALPRKGGGSRGAPGSRALCNILVSRNTSPTP